MIQIERLRAMAHQAIVDYQSALGKGGEPAYPEWADDILAVCVQAELKTLAADRFMSAQVAAASHRHYAI